MLLQDVENEIKTRGLENAVKAAMSTYALESAAEVVSSTGKSLNDLSIEEAIQHLHDEFHNSVPLVLLLSGLLMQLR